MGRRIVLGLIWLSFVVYTIWLAPLDRAYTWFVARKLLTLQWGDLNAYLPAIFSLMGVWPMIYACLMFADGRMQPIRAWPPFLGSNFTGVICLTPYLLLRQPNQAFDGYKDKVIGKLDQRSTGFTLLGIAIALIAYAVIAGDWGDYVQQFQTRHFVHLISLDFCLMCLFFPLTDLLDDDMARRGIESRAVFWAVALVPLLGPLCYLCWRPPLAQAELQ
ncbi:MAG: DUF2834 domain-containing protein [Cyanobacteria bacterium Co-bin8]|nr:DUF2834 domain-containing protein [Cyanobacteria bacterium Co-bin8]